MELVKEYDKIKYQLFKDFEAKNQIEYEFNTGGDVYHWGDYYAITIDDVITDLKSNAPISEYECFIDFCVEHPKFKINYINWLKFGGSRNIEEIEKLAQRKLEDELKQSQIAMDNSEKILMDCLPKKEPKTFWSRLLEMILISMILTVIVLFGHVSFLAFTILLSPTAIFYTIPSIVLCLILFTWWYHKKERIYNNAD